MKTKKILSILIIIVILLLAFAIFNKFYNPKDSINSKQLSDKEIKSLVNKVSKLMIVPNETPVIATIIKAEELKAEQSFYIDSKDGDYLIVFPTAKKAIIYREKEDILINVGPIIVDQSTTTTKTKEEVVASTTDKKDRKPE